MGRNKHRLKFSFGALPSSVKVISVASQGRLVMILMYLYCRSRSFICHLFVKSQKMPIQAIYSLQTSTPYGFWRYDMLAVSDW